MDATEVKSDWVPVVSKITEADNAVTQAGRDMNQLRTPMTSASAMTANLNFL